MRVPCVLLSVPLLVFSPFGMAAPTADLVEPVVIHHNEQSGVEVVFLAGGTAACPASAHCYAVLDRAAKQAVMIDPGPETARVMYGWLCARDLVLRYVCVTHAHRDHVGGLGDVVGHSRARIVAHRVEARRFPRRWRPLAEGEEGPGLPADRYLFLTDRQTLRCGHMTFRVLLTPGHTIGSLCFELVGEGIVFVGDTIFRESIGRTDLRGSAGTFCLIEYARVNILSLPEDVQLWPGHDDPTTVGHEKRYNPAFK